MLMTKEATAGDPHASGWAISVLQDAQDAMPKIAEAPRGAQQQNRRVSKGLNLADCDLIVRCAVQYPEQRPPPAWPLQIPRPTSRVSLPDPDAYLSWTVTDARTAPDLPTCPPNFTRLGCVTTPSFMFTEKL
jgi:hypothetical protein